MIAETFFSTVAKVTATIIGFALAVFTVYFQINRQSRLDQTEEVIGLVEEFTDEYQDVLGRTRKLIQDRAGPGFDTRVKASWAVKNPEELKKELRNDPDIKNPETAYVYVLLHGIEHICGNVAYKQTAAGDIPNERFFEKLPELIDALVDYFQPLNDERDWINFYIEISKNPEGLDSPLDRYGEDILPKGESEFYPDSLAHWVEYQDETQLRPHNHYDITGLGMPSILLLAISMQNDYQIINRKLRGSLINYDPSDELGNIVHKLASPAIVCFGLVIPMIMLIDSPTLFPSLAARLPQTIVVEIIQYITIPVLIGGFYYQFKCIFKEVIEVDNG